MDWLIEDTQSRDSSVSRGSEATDMVAALGGWAQIGGSL
jgi:hypothetical protein